MPKHPSSLDTESTPPPAPSFSQTLANLPYYEPRPLQERMMRSVQQALSQGHHLMVEAGTGSGKSFAYLLPLLADPNTPRPIVVSTGSIALQEQLLNKDIPQLSELLYGKADALTARLVKGRSNYLCIHKLDELETTLGDPKPREDKTTQGLRLQLGQLKAELYNGWSGDKATLDFPLPTEMWKEVQSDSDECLGWRCRFFDQNPYRLAREDLEQADVLVVNHALYCQDVVTGGGLLPPHSLVVFDEAHSLVGFAQQAFSSHIGHYRTSQLLGRINKRLLPLPDSLLWHLKEVEANLLEWLLKQANGRGVVRLTNDPNLAVFARDMQDSLYEVQQWLQALSIETLPGVTDDTSQKKYLAQQEKLSEQLKDLVDAWGLFASHHHLHERVHWAEVDKQRLVYRLHSTPLNVKHYLQAGIWHQRQAVLTSATLAIQHRLAFAREQLGLWEPASATAVSVIPIAESHANSEPVAMVRPCAELVLPSTFDTATQCRYYIPTPKTLPELPEDPAYWPAFIDTVTQLLEASEGRAFLLFTSYKAMHRAMDALLPRVFFPMRMQGEWPRHRLIEWFQQTPNSVLLGTATFWEGIDIPGEALSLVVIDRLPFTAPDEPVHQATVDGMKAQGADWFGGYALPQAVLRLKQGVGRLLRRKEDRGVVALLDTRLRSKGYGKTVLASLPTAPVTDSLEAIHAFFANSP
ncbi:MAG: ATP-dependent DNA helicase [Vampirovibrionales bacterium]